MATIDTSKLSYDILLKSNNKLQKEATIFHKVMTGEGFTKHDVVEYAQSQVQTKTDILELLKTLRDNYVKMDYLPDVKKIKTFNNLIKDTQESIDFYTAMKEEFNAQEA